MVCKSEKLQKILAGLFSYSPIGIKYAVACASLLWGIILLLPNEAYTITLFDGMNHLLAENQWGLLFLFHGLISFFCTITHKKDLVAFVLDVTYGMILWTTVTVALVVSSKIIPAHLSAQIVLAICTIWLFIRFNLQKGQ